MLCNKQSSVLKNDFLFHFVLLKTYECSGTAMALLGFLELGPGWVGSASWGSTWFHWNGFDLDLLTQASLYVTSHFHFIIQAKRDFTTWDMLLQKRAGQDASNKLLNALIASVWKWQRSHLLKSHCPTWFTQPRRKFRSQQWNGKA